jgi:integrase
MNTLAQPDRNAEYLLVRELRKIITGVSQKVSEKTQRDYLQKHERMKNTDSTPENIAGTKKAYYAYRAALLFGTSADAREAFRARDMAVYGSDEWKAAISVLHRCNGIFTRYPPDPERQHRENGSASFMWEGIKSNKLKTVTGWSATIASKKRILSKLRKIPDWRSKLFEQVTPKHQDAAALCAITGVRPSEIARGVNVRLSNDADGQRLIITISGSKITANSGQPVRILRVKIDSAEARHLANNAANGTLNIVTHPANLCAAIIKAGRTAFPHLRETVTPYVFRHSLASDLKAANISPDAIAQILGHQASESQQAYGFAVCASGLMSIDGVQATLPVRSTHRRPHEHLGMSFTMPSPQI